MKIHTTSITKDWILELKGLQEEGLFQLFIQMTVCFEKKELRYTKLGL